MPDLATLNAAERETLALLARGHTAKSIAGLTGRSVASVNERLREARRKTGMGSSRELARLLAAQESRDEQIGVAAAAGRGSLPAAEAAPRRAGGIFAKAALTMTLLISAAALALFVQASPPASPDPMLDGVIGAADQTAPQLHARLRAEGRDGDWAALSEAALRKLYATVPGLDQGEALRVVCARTLCEVAGSFPGKDGATANAVMDHLQGPALDHAVRKLGFGEALLHGFGGDGGDKHMRFVIYWSRARA